MLVGCTWHVNGVDVGGAPGGADGAVPVADAGGTGGNGADDLGVRGGDTDIALPPVAPCYSEDYSPTVSLADLAAAYAPQAWKTTLLTALERRIAGGHALVSTMQNDPSLPNYVDASSFATVMYSTAMTCNGETSAYDGAHATSTNYALWMRSDLVLTPPLIPNFARNEIAQYLTDGATQSWDGALQGQPGSLGFTAVVGDLTAYVNGLACVTAVAAELQSPINARDGLAAQLYYLELFLKRARTAHPSAYAMLQASPDWVKVVRYSWARAAFWRKQATAARLGVSDAAIWAHVDDAANSSEIEQFTGGTLSDIECHP
jgi:hypothetical protein